MGGLSVDDLSSSMESPLLKIKAEPTPGKQPMTRRRKIMTLMVLASSMLIFATATVMQATYIHVFVRSPITF